MSLFEWVFYRLRGLADRRRLIQQRAEALRRAARDRRLELN